jgi:two-component system, OmpR family, response regulator VanR
VDEAILVVDDEKEIADLVELYLKNEGFSVLTCYTAREALHCIDTARLGMAILDVMLPDVDGLTLCQKIREKHNYPVIMLTAKEQETDKITGLTLGADDYVTKPFRPLELVARVKAQFRRYTRYNQHQPEREDGVIAFSGLVIDRDAHECTLNERALCLTPTEFSILWVLCANRGRVVSSEELFHAVWGEEYYTNDNNTVMVHIRHLREKMNDSAGRPKYIKTVWGVGYKIERELGKAETDFIPVAAPGCCMRPSVGMGNHVLSDRRRSARALCRRLCLPVPLCAASAQPGSGNSVRSYIS